MRQYNVGSPFERIAIDVAGPFPETDNGNKYIVVVMDYFSKLPLPFQTKRLTVADALIKDWICRFGNVCRTLDIRKTRTTALHPQSDGMVERMNRTINRGTGTSFSHLFLLAYRSSVHETTGKTSASIVMGRELRLPCDLKVRLYKGTTWLERTTSELYAREWTTSTNESVQISRAPATA
ncbi:hypothetical protein NQ318_013007 [Aromia moschata]|uniref:Integrase catalytic domain-containing protein n=1 Tax=Aromia moschata TaxID=1265417 RepID=A0AAV8XX00_9CUCU|nr:hypothetical protein NQ318_013007 [Aromia moschata]